MAKKGKIRDFLKIFDELLEKKNGICDRKILWSIHITSTGLFCFFNLLPFTFRA